MEYFTIPLSNTSTCLIGLIYHFCRNTKVHCVIACMFVQCNTNFYNNYFFKQRGISEHKLERNTQNEAPPIQSQISCKHIRAHCVHYSLRTHSSERWLTSRHKHFLLFGLTINCGFLPRIYHLIIS